MLFVRILAPALKPALAGGTLLVAAAGGWLTIDRYLGDSLTPFQTAARADGERLLIAEFGETADTVVAVNPTDPDDREEIARIRHAPGYGAFATLSPDGSAIAYTALPEDEPEPHAAAPAIAGVIYQDGTTAVLANDVDLLVPPVWRPDGAAIVVRKNIPLEGSAGAFSLLLLGTDGARAVLAERTGSALFPIAFSPDGSTFYFATLDPNGSDLWRTGSNGSGETLIAHMSDEIARDWKLSPDGRTIAYTVAESGPHPRIVTMTVNLDTGAATEVVRGPEQRIEFNPVWDTAGQLTIASVDDSGQGGAAIRVNGAGGADAISDTSDSLDLPLAWSPDGTTLAVRSIEGPAADGPSYVEVLRTDGGRERLSDQADVLIVGWLE